MSLIQIGLIDVSGQIDKDLMQAASIAFNLQVTRDLPQFWPVTATVIYLPDPSKLPVGIWPVRLVKSLPPGEGGFHADMHKQPYAQVVASKNDPSWTIDASHEILEMLIDPYGNRIQSSVAIEVVDGQIRDGTGQFGYLVEACDPCEDNDHAYTINGIAVSDFITPRFYDPVATLGTRYSFTGSLTSPRQILPGGYISWVNPETNEWQQLLYVNPDEPPTIMDIGPADQAKSLREWIDSVESSRKINRASRTSSTLKSNALFDYSSLRVAQLDRISLIRAKLYL
ncbi:hypothetical protein [Terriglobus sp. TAA 43]|uniref:hypothetical protein n=1 Tax=Terriglobus sp. TAA 43 TaxID=278961 RepID=UPI00068AEB76|nr:hypothetical protein [Terriglobus sp. TAA 43]